MHLIANFEVYFSFKTDFIQAVQLSFSPFASASIQIYSNSVWAKKNSRTEEWTQKKTGEQRNKRRIISGFRFDTIYLMHAYIIIVIILSYL